MYSAPDEKQQLFGGVISSVPTVNYHHSVRVISVLRGNYTIPSMEYLVS